MNYFLSEVNSLGDIWKYFWKIRLSYYCIFLTPIDLHACFDQFRGTGT